MLHVAPATLHHALSLAPSLRPADLQEIKSSSGQPARASIAHSIGHSLASWAALDAEGGVVLIFGVAPRGDGAGAPWMHASTLIHQHRTQVIRSTHEWVGRLHRHYRVLANYVDARNTLHIRWLRWAGFRFFPHPHTEVSVDGTPFLEFVRVSDV